MFKEAHIGTNLMKLIDTFAVKLLQIAVSDVSPKRPQLVFSLLN